MDAEQLLQLSDDEFMAQMATQQETAAAATTGATDTAAPAADSANVPLLCSGKESRPRGNKTAEQALHAVWRYDFADNSVLL